MNSQIKASGPVIQGFGEVYQVMDPDFKLDLSKDLKVVFDVSSTADSIGGLNKSLETAARFLNMHAQTGVPKERLKVAVVVHNQATKDVISDAVYRKKYGMDNPNSTMLTALMDTNVQIILCGQSSAARGFPKKDLVPGVQISLSAMTALLQLDGEGYTILKL
jgi:intracellular sulfur oxidation DsrE/DsrF family protein